MARPTWLVPLLLSAGFSGAAPGASGRPVFAYEADSLRATLTLIGGRGPEAPDSLAGAGWQVACSPADSSIMGPVAWYEVALIDKRAGTELRFPVDAAALRKGLRQACDDRGGIAPGRIAAGLQTLAAALKVRIQGPEGGAGE